METPSSPYVFEPGDRPLFVGAPYSARHTVARKVLYVVAATLTGIGATFDNALTSVNTNVISGNAGLYFYEASILPALYVAMNACGNLTTVKARARFGVHEATGFILFVYALAAGAQLVWPGFVSAAIARAFNGLAAAALTTIAVYYLLQIFQGPARPLALVTGLSLAQLGTPFARMVPVELLANDHWAGLHWLELGVALTLLTVVVGVRMPPNERVNLFEPIDFVSIALFVTAALLLCAVIGVGRIRWWFDTPVLGVATAFGIGALAIGVCIEVFRRRPLLDLGWIGTVAILRFAAVALLVRLALAEQTYGSIGLLLQSGLNNDQLRLLFGFVAIAMVLGGAVAVFTLSPTSFPYQVIAASLAIAAGAYLDSTANNLTRPPQLYLSQSLIGFGTTLFIGPTLGYGLLRVLTTGGQAVFISTIVLFSTTQNVGGLFGSAILGTIQTISVRAHAGALSEHLVASDPNVVARLNAGVVTITGQTPDPAAQAIEGTRLLSNALYREANVLAFNDTFTVVVVLALGAAVAASTALCFRRSAA